jgi:hypothetical protein
MLHCTYKLHLYKKRENMDADFERCLYWREINGNNVNNAITGQSNFVAEVIHFYII